MGLLKRREINSEMEEKILTGLIISNQFCRDIGKIISKEIFNATFIGIAVDWCKDYYKKYKTAPKAQVKDIFEVEKKNLDDADRIAISDILSRLSLEYEQGEFSDEEINIDYLKDRTIEYIKERQLQTVAKSISKLLDLGRVQEAEKILDSYRKVSITTAGWENPFDPEIVKNFFVDEMAQRDIIFQFPGDIGRFIGPLERNWLVGFLAPTKRGKTFWLIESAIQATFQRKKALFISLEMSMHRVKKRFYRRLTSMSENREYVIPVFDCLHNQDDSCGKTIRTNHIALLNAEGKKPLYDKNNPYSACTACRGGKDFAVATWFINEKRNKTTANQASKLIKSQAAQFGSSFRMISYPAYSANLKRVRSDIQTLIDMEGFIPDVIVIDYADILAPEDAKIVGRDRIDETWKSLKNMADEIHCCVITASQSNRQSFDKKNVTQQDTSEDIRKIANSDMFLAINQTPAEKRESCARISRIAVRDGDFDQFDDVTVLQQLSLGQVLLDSYWPMTEKFSTFEEDFFI